MGTIELTAVFWPNLFAGFCMAVLTGILGWLVGKVAWYQLDKRRGRDAPNRILQNGATLAGISVGWALSYALPLTPGEASGWWQVIAVLAGLPIFFDQLKKIEEEARRAKWKPEIVIGLMPYEGDDSRPLPLSTTLVEENLSNAISLSDSTVYNNLLLVIQNRGELSAKFVKIHLEFEPSDIHSTFIPTIEFKEHKFEPNHYGKDYIFYGGSDNVIYPHDVERFRMYIHPQRRSNTYRFHCTVWADGLDNPVKKHLTIRFSS